MARRSKLTGHIFVTQAVVKIQGTTASLLRLTNQLFASLLVLGFHFFCNLAKVLRKPRRHPPIGLVVPRGG